MWGGGGWGATAVNAEGGLLGLLAAAQCVSSRAVHTHKTQQHIAYMKRSVPKSHMAVMSKHSVLFFGMPF